MSNLLQRFIRNETGVTSIEYGIIGTMIAVAIVGAATTLGNNIANTWGIVANNMK